MQEEPAFAILKENFQRRGSSAISYLGYVHSMDDHHRAVRIPQNALRVRAQHPAMKDGVAALAHHNIGEYMAKVIHRPSAQSGYGTVHGFSYVNVKLLPDG
jgi:predicted HD phosphohydrolase